MNKITIKLSADDCSHIDTGLYFLSLELRRTQKNFGKDKDIYDDIQKDIDEVTALRLRIDKEIDRSVDR